MLTTHNLVSEVVALGRLLLLVEEAMILVMTLLGSHTAERLLEVRHAVCICKILRCKRLEGRLHLVTLK